MYYFIVI